MLNVYFFCKRKPRHTFVCGKDLTMKCFKMYFALLLTAMASSCRPDEDSPGGRNYFINLDNLTHDQIVLGEKLDDPYALSAMQLSLANLYPTKSGVERLEATDYYVRFLPQDDLQFTSLRLMGVNLTDHPLDYEILREGDYYHDPSLQEGDITWQYAVVDKDFHFPDDIRYEILEQCYIPENADTKAGDVDWEEVEREAYRITGNAHMLLPRTRAADEGMPSGTIKIVDDKYKGGEPIGVSGVKVSVNSFVKFASAYTDASGNYVIPRSFSSEMRYRLVFQNEKGFGLGIDLLLVPASVSTLGSGPAEGISVKITKDSDRKLFSRCVVNNAVYDYFMRCTREGVKITPPPQNLRIWLFQGIGSSSAPMLHQGSVVEASTLSDYLGSYKDLVKHFLPDITMGLRYLDDYSDIYNYTQHELAHASHYVRVGNSYWNKYIKHVLKSYVTSGMKVYGVGTEPEAGYCEVGEMWAYYLQNVLYKERYGSYQSELGTSYWFHPQILLYMDDRGIDDSKIFTALMPTVTDRERLQQSLVELYPESRYIIDQAFNRYLN